MSERTAMTVRDRPQNSGGSIATTSLSTGATVPSLSSPLPPGWLAGWSASEMVPATVDEVQASLTSFLALTAPSRPQDVVLALVPAIELYGRPDGWDRQSALYVGLLRDIPPDLLQYGVWAAMARSEFFPRPALIRAQVAAELSRRHDIRLRLSAACAIARRADLRRQRRSA